jgi:hypothetical protein
LCGTITEAHKLGCLYGVDGKAIKLVIMHDNAFEQVIDCTESFADLLKLSDFHLHELISLQTYRFSTMHRKSQSRFHWFPQSISSDREQILSRMGDEIFSSFEFKRNKFF